MSAEGSTSRFHVPGKVRWRRFAIVAVPAVAIAGVLVGLTAEGAIASSISVSGEEYTVTASQLSGNGFEQFGGSVSNAKGPQPVIVSAINRARLTDLCQSREGRAGHAAAHRGRRRHPATADNLIVDASGQTGSVATFTNISIGLDAGTLTEDPGTTGGAGSFGEQADTVTIDNLNQDTWLTTAGTFTLPDLRLGFGGGC